MSASDHADLRDEIRQLHREKDAAYRDAWKKRGEVISILANIARKVDRLTYVADGAPTTVDESLRDTAIDLLVYSLKYQTYLADLDPVVAESCSPAANSVYRTATVQTDLSICCHRSTCPGQMPSP